MKIQLPGVKGGLRLLPELPYAWWPVLASTSILGVNELGLRLPGLLLSLPVLWLLFGLTRRFYGRPAAWLASLALLGMPLFSYHLRLALGGGMAMAWIALSSLAFLWLLGDEEASPLWIWLAWITWALAGATAGVPGLIIPLALLGAGLVSKRTQAKRILLSPALGVGLLILALAWWRAMFYQPQENWPALLLLSDSLEAGLSAAKRPSFEAFVHQLGFGLFPLGALLPLAFADLIWRPRLDNESQGASPLAPALAMGFAAAFLAPAIGLHFSQYGLFLAPPLVAMALGVYLARVLRSGPQPLLVLTTVVLVAILDSNLKHETHALADTLISARVDAFPPKLSGWFFARMLNMALLGLLLLHQGGLHRYIVPVVRGLIYPRRSLGLFNGWMMALALLPPIPLFVYRPDAFLRILSARAWGRLIPEARQLILFGILWLLGYLILLGLWNWRVKHLKGRREGFATSWASDFEYLVTQPLGRLGGLLGILALWAFFLNIFVAQALTTNFSQKEILSIYEDLAEEGEPLYRYKLKDKSSSFYSRKLPDLKPGEFTQKAKQPGRFFSIIPRDRLARINTEFRNATGKTLPVLDDKGWRFLLVSNELGESEDRNPIKRALVPSLPDGAHSVTVNFEDKIQIEGWKVEPKEPRPGSPITITIYWRALQKISHNWKVFVHIDSAGQRIHGDHEPVEGLFLTTDWKKGDLIQDTYYKVVKSTVSPAHFTFYAGLFRGGTRMKIKSGPKDNDNRARLGKIRVR